MADPYKEAKSKILKEIGRILHGIANLFSDPLGIPSALRKLIGLPKTKPQNFNFAVDAVMVVFAIWYWSKESDSILKLASFLIASVIILRCLELTLRDKESRHE